MPRNRLLHVIYLCAVLSLLAACSKQEPLRFEIVATIGETPGEFGEPFGIASNGGEIYFSDGANGTILKIAENGTFAEFASGFDTPSAIAFAKNGDLIVADSGSHTINAVSPAGEVRIIAGVKGRSGLADGGVSNALFNGPIGIAISQEEKIFVADSYNDRIRLIDNGNVSTFAGGDRGFQDGRNGKFDTPLGLAIWRDKVLVADAGNRRVRVIEPDGYVWTMAGDGEQGSRDGQFLNSSFVRPAAIAINDHGQIFVADGHWIRTVGARGVFPYVVTLSGGGRGFRDGDIGNARFNRPSGLAFTTTGELLIADSENGVVRTIGTGRRRPQNKEQVPRQFSAVDFKKLQPARWPFNPPTAPRDIAGTLGELRGTQGSNVPLRFHNGLDIAGAYGETAYFIRSEKVLDPISAENFGTLRELIRLPQIGYIHVRLGRDDMNASWRDPRFQFETNDYGIPVNVRVRRGTKFDAGEPVGTLNAMNHVHLIAGPSGSEINALAALDLPGISDSIPPTIENAAVYDLNWTPVETNAANSRIKLAGKYRVIVRAFDRMDGNPDRRKLGVYKLGYQLFGEDGSAIGNAMWQIIFDRMPRNDLAKFIYGEGSHSGASGVTIYNYIVTNKLVGDEFGEGFFDTAELAAGSYTIRVFVGDYFGNVSSKDIHIEVIE